MAKWISRVLLASLIGILVFASLPQAHAMAQTVSDETLIKQTISTYFDLMYQSRTDSTPREFGQLIATTAQAQRFLQGERDRREVEYHRAKLFNLSYVSYSYTLDYQSLQIDSNSGTASVTLLEGFDVVFKQTAPEVSQMRNTKHAISLMKINGEWKIIEDNYDSIIGRVLNSGITKTRAMQLNIENYDEVLESEKAHSSVPTLPTRSMSGNSINRTGAVNYAATYYQNYNSAYTDFTGNDCTNFVNQALREGGGVGMTTEYSSGWYYNKTNGNHSVPWTTAPDLLHFILYVSATGGPEGVQKTAASYLNGADIIGFDWGGDGLADHLVLVTTNEGTTVYIASHDPDYYHVSYTIFGPWSGIWYVQVTGW